MMCRVNTHTDIDVKVCCVDERCWFGLDSEKGLPTSAGAAPLFSFFFVVGTCVVFH